MFAISSLNSLALILDFYIGFAGRKPVLSVDLISQRKSVNGFHVSILVSVIYSLAVWFTATSYRVGFSIFGNISKELFLLTLPKRNITDLGIINLLWCFFYISVLLWLTNKVKPYFKLFLCDAKSLAVQGLQYVFVTTTRALLATKTALKVGAV